MHFMWNCLTRYTGREVLNVGCANDPFLFGERCTHFDIDDWSKHFDARGLRFIQGDAHELSEHVGWDSYDLVICGDTLEHCPSPTDVLFELARVTRGALCLTVWEEWRLPGEGLHIREGQKRADEEVQALGFADRLAHQRELYPDVVTFPEEDVPHLIHIWQFTPEMMRTLIDPVCDIYGMRKLFFQRVPETVTAGHQVYNWLIFLTKT